LCLSDAGAGGVRRERRRGRKLAAFGGRIGFVVTATSLA
jgi:hypothetical protein